MNEGGEISKYHEVRAEIDYHTDMLNNLERILNLVTTSSESTKRSEEFDWVKKQIAYHKSMIEKHKGEINE